MLCTQHDAISSQSVSNLMPFLALLYKGNRRVATYTHTDIANIITMYKEKRNKDREFSPNFIVFIVVHTFVSIHFSQKHKRYGVVWTQNIMFSVYKHKLIFVSRRALERKNSSEQIFYLTFHVLLGHEFERTKFSSIFVAFTVKSYQKGYA